MISNIIVFEPEGHEISDALGFPKGKSEHTTMDMAFIRIKKITCLSNLLCLGFRPNAIITGTLPAVHLPDGKLFDTISQNQPVLEEPHLPDYKLPQTVLPDIALPARELVPDILTWNQWSTCARILVSDQTPKPKFHTQFSRESINDSRTGILITSIEDLTANPLFTFGKANGAVRSIYKVIDKEFIDTASVKAPNAYAAFNIRKFADILKVTLPENEWGAYQQLLGEFNKTQREIINNNLQNSRFAHHH